MRSRDERALDLYLLVHAIASAPPWDVTLPASVWGRTIGLTVPGQAESAVSKAWKRLESRKLITRRRIGRKSSIILLNEDGSGAPYAHPGGKRHQPYLQLPYRYWTADEEWHRTLPLAAKAVLLVGLSLPQEFILPMDKAPRWYGISADTTHRGIKSLRQHGLIDSRKEFKKAPLAPKGYTEQIVYSLRAPFARMRRAS